MDISVVERNDQPGAWSVEAIDHDADGSCYVTVFYGPRSQERAQEYAAWQKAGAITRGDLLDNDYARDVMRITPVQADAVTRRRRNEP